MPIVVACSGCPTKLSAPESAVGKQIRCPKCGTVATVPAPAPAAEAPVVDATVVSSAPGPKRVLADADDSGARPRKPAPREGDDEERPRRKKRPRYADDDDDYEHDHPRARRRRRSREGGGTVIALVVVGLLVLAGVGTGIYVTNGKGLSLTQGTKATPVPRGWRSYGYPEDGFRAYFPREPVHVSVPKDQLIGNRLFGGGQFNMGGFQTHSEKWEELEGVGVYQTSGPNDPVQTGIMVIRFRNGVPDSVRDELWTLTNRGANGNDVKTIRWLGHDAFELTVRAGVSRTVIADRYLIGAAVCGPNGTRARPEEEAGFFDNFELTR